MIELDELQLVVVTDNETDTLSSIDNTQQHSEAAGLLERLEPAFIIDDHTHTSVFDQLCCACHGFSVLATGLHDGQQRTVLFDVGPYGDIWLANAGRLGIDLATIETIFLSHWHWDHSGGLVDAITAIAAARREAGLPPPVADVHPDRPEQRGIQLPDGRVMLLPVDPTIDELETAGATVATVDADHPIADGFFHGSGEIPRTPPSRPDSMVTARLATESSRPIRSYSTNATSQQQSEDEASPCSQPAPTPASSTPLPQPAIQPTPHSTSSSVATTSPAKPWNNASPTLCRHSRNSTRN